MQIRFTSEKNNQSQHFGLKSCTIEEELFGYHKSEFNFESKLIKNDSKNIYNRLQSIVADALFVEEMINLMPTLALISNERCGSWYTDTSKRKPYSAYFKSTDGHMHIWDFNIRRNNLHLIPIIVAHCGCMIVDSTRKGKRFPDALSKTIPIWCCVINRAVQIYRTSKKDNTWDLKLHTLPTVVSRSEHTQIESRIDGFVEKLLTSGVDLEMVSAQLSSKPLRPIWFTPTSFEGRMMTLPDFSEADFWPVVCVSASEAVKSGCIHRPGYLYVQGSADDQEAWAMGLTQDLFWKHREDILANQAECESKIKSLVERVRKEGPLDDGETAINGKNFAIIEPTPLAVGNYASGKPPMCWKEFDAVVNCSEKEWEGNREKEGYLWLPIPEGKKGQAVFGNSIQKAIDFVEKFIMDDKKVLVYCSTGKDHSVGILLCILIYYYDLKGQLNIPNKPRVDKKTVQYQLVKIISKWENAAPSRVTLKRVNTYFMSRH